MTCKYCSRAVGAFLFRNLHLQIQSTQQLPSAVNNFTSALRAVNGLGFVRRLHITAEPLNTTTRWHFIEEEDQNDTEHSQHEDESKSEDGMEHTWTSLACLIERLPALKDLVYESRTQQFPPILLDAIRKSACRLHLHGFYLQSCLRSHTCDMSDPVLLEPYEMELIASPNLYAIQRQRGFFALKSSGHYDYDRYDYNDDAIKQLVSFIPSLKELTYLPASRRRHYLRDRNDSLNRERRSHSRPSWPALSLEGPLFEHPQKESELISLTLGHAIGSAFSMRGGPFQSRMLEAWSQKVDFAQLQSLSLVNANDGDALTWLAHKASDMMLRSIKLEGASNAVPELSDLLTALSPLETLDLLGSFGPSIPNAIFEQHGSTLCCLSLRGHSVMSVHFP